MALFPLKISDQMSTKSDVNNEKVENTIQYITIQAGSTIKSAKFEAKDFTTSNI